MIQIESPLDHIVRHFTQKTIDLTQIGGTYRRLEPHEDIHHPDYFEAKREVDKCTDNPAKFDGQGWLGTAASRRETPDSTDSPDGKRLIVREFWVIRRTFVLLLPSLERKK